MHQIPDSHARQEALNPQYSYIVQAPAGSGKTELLIQRFLKLLATVTDPESIIALTFTKKAAHEMHYRISSILDKARRHEKITHSITEKLAHEVLACDSKYQWHLHELPHRLRIQTIDALCASLVSQMPVLSHGTAYATVTDDPSSLYEEAAHRCLEESQSHPHYQKAVKTLLLHFGNHYNRCLQLLSDMLSWREQWLPYLVPAQDTPPLQLKKQLEQALQHVISTSESALNHCFSEEIKKELNILCAFAADNLKKSHRPLQAKETFWTQVSNLLLTKDHLWRSRVDKNIGFPSPSDTKDPEEKKYLKEMKSRLENLLAALRTQESCRQALEHYRHCPPCTYSASQWEILQALITLLPLLVAQLKIIFMETQKTDFSEIAEQASSALGALNQPSELALYLDYRLQHLLIDEFQDTSLQQFYLLEKLIDGWQENDGRTLFIVGDPMQSIYSFREAEVSLFLKVQQSGMGNLSLRSLTLSCNFRSHPHLVEWTNTCFRSIFPEKNDPTFGAIKHHRSVGIPLIEGGSVPFFWQESKTAIEQAEQIIQRIQAIPSSENIAILVRSRSQLTRLLPALQQAGILFQGMDIDPLITRPYIRDLLSLIQTLLQPANRLAWLSVLRAPWCGLTSADLLVVAQNDHLGEKQALSVDGQIRFKQTAAIIKKARNDRQQQNLACWVESTWRALKGHLCVSSQVMEDIEIFWTLLEQYNYESFNLTEHLFNQVNRLFSNKPQESRLHIMTIHKSKGLEFDHVILPHLEASSKKQDQPLLYMEQRDHHFMLAPIRSVDVEEDTIYQYLQYIQHKKELFERQRLLYVALTRARAQVHLFSVQSSDKTHSFLKWLSPFLSSPLCSSPSIEAITVPSSTFTLSNTSDQIIRLKSSYYYVTEEESASQKIPPIPPLKRGEEGRKYPLKREGTLEEEKVVTKNLLRLTGIFIHEQIRYCAENQLLTWEAIDKRGWRSRMHELGVYTKEEQEKVSYYTCRALNNMYEDPRGQWILKPHTQGRNEYPLHYFDPTHQEMAQIILDRTFVDEENRRWIIDYKITESFSSSEQKEIAGAPLHHRVQLENYAKVLTSMLTESKSTPGLSIFLGLYYPLTKNWIAWSTSCMLY